MSHGIPQELRLRGWAHADSFVEEDEMAAYAAAARSVIELALEYQDIEELLNQKHKGSSYGLQQARTPGLDADKETLQLGYQSEVLASQRLQSWHQPTELRAFWPLHSRMLTAARISGGQVLREIGGPELKRTFYPERLADEDTQIRTNWYRNAVSDGASEGREILSGHADRGVLTLHMFETHRGYLLGTSYPREVAHETDETLRAQKVAEMLSKLKSVEPTSDHIVAFLGAGWWNLPASAVPEGVRDLPALYHVGVTPDLTKSHETQYAHVVTKGAPDRFSVVAFTDPPHSMIEAGVYEVPSRKIARPALETT